MDPQSVSQALAGSNPTMTGAFGLTPQQLQQIVNAAPGGFGGGQGNNVSPNMQPTMPQDPAVMQQLAQQAQQQGQMMGVASISPPWQGQLAAMGGGQ